MIVYYFFFCKAVGGTGFIWRGGWFGWCGFVEGCLVGGGEWVVVGGGVWVAR